MAGDTMIARTGEGAGVRWAFALLTAAILVLFALELRELITGPSHYLSLAGVDFGIYTDAARRWLSGGSWFADRQLHGPYPIEAGDVLYPPATLWLFVPFTVLPAVLWWIVPLGSIVLLMAHWRPAPWTWPLMALSILWPQTPLKVITGNPGMWIAAAVALGLRYGGPGALILLKPSFAPLALIGIRHRSWWLVAGGIALASLPFETLNLTYLSTILDARGQSILYSLPDLPLLLIPLIAWAGRQR